MNSDYNPLSLVTSEELINELERRGRVFVCMLLVQTAPNELKTYRRLKWNQSSVFEAIGVQAVMSTHMNAMLAQVHNDSLKDQQPPANPFEDKH